MFLFCSFDESRRSRRSKREQDAVPDNWHRVGAPGGAGPLARAPRPGTLHPLGAHCGPGILAWTGFRKAGRGASHAPRRLPALQPLFREGRKKGYGGPARAPEFKARVRGALAALFLSEREPATSGPAWIEKLLPLTTPALRTSRATGTSSRRRPTFTRWCGASSARRDARPTSAVAAVARSRSWPRTVSTRSATTPPTRCWSRRGRATRSSSSRRRRCPDLKECPRVRSTTCCAKR